MAIRPYGFLYGRMAIRPYSPLCLRAFVVHFILNKKKLKYVKFSAI
jgi:hypothetical protein